MNNLKDRFLQLSYALLGLIWLAIAAGFVAYAFGFFADFGLENFLESRAGILLLYGIGALSALVGLYFLRKFIASYRMLLSFVQESDFGNIHISHYAVKELTSEILKRKLDLSSFRTSLSQASDGVQIEVYAKIHSKADIGELGERVQEVLRREIPDKTGLTVGRVDFYTQGVEEEKEDRSNSEPEEPEVEDITLKGDKDEN